MNARSILIVANGYPSKKYPLNGIFELDQAKALMAIGHRVIYAAIDLRSIRRWRKWGVQHFLRDCVEVYLINIPVGRAPATCLDEIGKIALRFLYRRIQKEHGRPDLLHAHFLGPGVISANLCQRESLPLAITEHSSKINKVELQGISLVRAKKAYRQANAIIAVSSALANNIKKNTGIEARIIPNIVSRNIYKYQPKQKGDDFIFVSVGGLIPSKGFDVLLVAFNQLVKKYPQCKLSIYGAGPLRKALLSQIRELKLDGKARLLNRQPREILARDYGLASAFVLASRTETFGVVYIEAMAAGLPVIATRCGGPEDFVTPETGILIPVEDVNALTDAMEYMVSHRDEYDSIEISNYARTQFSPEKIASELTIIYNDILEGSN